MLFWKLYPTGVVAVADFLAELKRRHIYRVAAAYAVVAWVLLQIVNNVAPIMEAPAWVAQFCLLLLALGFPLTIFFAWIRELAPEAVGGAGRVVTGKLDGILAIALFIVIGLVSYQQIAGSQATITQPSGVEGARAAASTPSTAISLAVLPFTNLSGDPGQEFFSDGMTEEITSALAKIPDLRVVGRTSAFQFKGQSKDLRSIGQALGATHLLEGSVRRDGNRLRITAQLILAENGVHVWTENYDRELTSVFAIQEDIATAIAGALRMPLGLKPGEQLVSSRTDNLESYQQLLLLRAQYRARRGNGNPFADLEKIVARDPSYAPAWALLARYYQNYPQLELELWSRSVEETRNLLRPRLAKAEKAAREAIRLDPRQADAYVVLAFIELTANNLTGAEELGRQALTFDTNETEALGFYANFLNLIGRRREALTVRQQMVALEPLVPIYTVQYASTLLVNGRTEEAISVLEALPPHAVNGFRDEVLARAYAQAGRFAESADAILTIPKFRYGDSGKSLEDAARLMRSAPVKTNAPGALPVLATRLNFVYAYIGAPDRVMELTERQLEIGTNAGNMFFWDPLFAPQWKSERFKAILRKMKLVDYWRAKGWPDFCMPIGADDFACD